MKILKHLRRISLCLLTFCFSLIWTVQVSSAEDLWTMAQNHKQVHRLSTLFTAQDVRDLLSKGKGTEEAIQWCKKTGVTKVYIEEFRDGYQAKRDALLKAKEAFLKEGFEVSGCITTTRLGKPSTGWGKEISCLTHRPNQERIKSIFEYAAGLFDEIMIDDFWFNDCSCVECTTARKSRTVRIGEKTFPVPGDSWSEYRCELMVNLSREYVLAAGRQINPKVTFIVKFPQWYELFQERGYEVIRETADFDRTWVGTEIRDYTDKQWGGNVPYAAFFLMRWLGQIGGEKCGGGWYDWLGTTEKTYIEQARQTVLGGARESMLFCYGGLQSETGPKNVAALREHVPELFEVAGEIQRRPIIGIAVYKPPNSDPGKENNIFDFLGMLGFPLVPCHQFPEEAPAAFFSIHALKDPELGEKISSFIRSGKPVLITDGLASRLKEKIDWQASNVRILKVNGAPKSLLQMPAGEVNALREPFLKPFQTALQAPSGIGFYLFKDGSWVMENFNDQPAQVRLNDQEQTLQARGWLYRWR